MNLEREQDRELHTLLAALFDGPMTAQQEARLGGLLRDDPNHQQAYLDCCWIHGLLRRGLGADLLTATGGERQAETGMEFSPSSPADLPVPAFGFLSTALHGTVGYFSEGMPFAYLMATVVTGLGLLIGLMVHVSGPDQVARHAVPSAVVTEPSAEYVGRITGMVDCRWEKKGLGIRDWGLEKRSRTGNPTCQSLVSLGDKFMLAFGLMEITYNTGAKVILQGPVTYEAESNGGYLSIGRLTGKLEKRGEGPAARGEKSARSSSFILHPSSFVIRTPTATVTDLGTEFGVQVDRSGVTEAHVFVGAIKIASARAPGHDGEAQTVRAGSAVRFDGKSARITRTELKERQFVRVLPADPQAARADAYAQLVLSLRPVAYYRMERPKNEKDRNVVFDSAPGGHHGVLHMGDDRKNPWWRGRFGNALRLGEEGTDDYADVRDFPAAETNQLSISAWVCTWRREDWWAKIVHEGQLDGQFAFGVNEFDGDLMAGVRQRDGGEVRVREGASKPLPLNQWQHVAFVADGQVLRLYRNGTEVAASPCDGVYRVPLIKHLAIGCQINSPPSDPPLGCFWHGRIDELAMFYRALSAKEIRQLFEGREEGASP